MTDAEKLELIHKLVARLATNTNHFKDEDFNPYDISGGNFDDAFEAGVEQGYGDLAREILDVITKKD